MTGLLLWESCCIPSLIYNSSTWQAMGKEEEKVLNECQDFFLRLLWDTGPGAPKVALRADTATRDMVVRVWKEKILLIHHISNLKDGDLAKMMLEEQSRNNWEGLYKEVTKICETIGVEDPTKTEDSKKVYARKVKEACKMKDEQMMMCR